MGGEKGIGVDCRTMLCMYTNIKSILNKEKREEIEILLKEKDVDILG